jgi:exonuclease III
MKRYDFIYASPQFKPLGVQYLLDESILASSDHALVIADFEILTNQPEIQ